jgi:putative FmdB family regulatory protein
MPIYDFQCSGCGHKGEVMRKMSESNTIACPNCQRETFEKMLSAPSFQLTGSGWYATDFKSKNKTSAESASAEAKSETPAPTSCAPGCACH